MSRMCSPGEDNKEGADAAKTDSEEDVGELQEAGGIDGADGSGRHKALKQADKPGQE